MNRTEIENRIRELEEKRDRTSDPEVKRIIEENISYLEEQLADLDREAHNRTTGQKIGSTVGRIGGSVVGIFMGVVDDCLNGNTNKKITQRTRGKYADGGEAIGSAIGGVVENISAAIKRRRK